MERLGRFSLLWALGAVALACSCTSDYAAPACHLVGPSSVVFLGTPIRTAPDPLMPKAPDARIYVFRVDRAYKGLPADTKEVVINPDNYGCETYYRLGRQYIVFAMSWEGTSQYFSGACSGSREAQRAPADVEFLEAYAKGNSATRVFGKTLQLVPGSWRLSEDEEAPVGGARVTLDSPKDTRQTQSTRDGAYSFDGIPPGEYTLSADLDRYRLRAPWKVQVFAGACVERFLELRPSTALSGIALDHRGEPATKTRIELMRRNASGKWVGGGDFWKTTDESGRFEFSNIPTGDYLLGHAIQDGRPSFDDAVPTWYHAGVPDEAGAAVIGISADQRVRDVVLRLPPPDAPRRISAVVTWPDGKAAGPNLLQISVNGEIVESAGGAFKARASKTTVLAGHAGRAYEISARYWVDEDSQPFRRQHIAESNVAVVEPGTGPVTIRLVLGPPKPVLE